MVLTMWLSTSAPCPLHPMVSKPSPACLDREGHHGKGHAVSGVICKRGWLDDSDTDREMEVASQVYTRDVERMYEAKKSKTMAALHDVERIESIKKTRVRTRYFQIHNVFHTCFPAQPT